MLYFYVNICFKNMLEARKKIKNRFLARKTTNKRCNKRVCSSNLNNEIDPKSTNISQT